jgi:hypothetical protein
MMKMMMMMMMMKIMTVIRKISTVGIGKFVHVLAMKRLGEGGSRGIVPLFIDVGTGGR